MICGHVSLIMAMKGRGWPEESWWMPWVSIHRNAQRIHRGLRIKIWPGRYAPHIRVPGNNPQAYFVVDRSDKG